MVSIEEDCGMAKGSQETEMNYQPLLAFVLFALMVLMFAAFITAPAIRFWSGGERRKPCQCKECCK